MLDKTRPADGVDPMVPAVPSYATLLENKVIVPSTSSPYLAIDQHFFFDCFVLIISRIHFDENWYLSKYRDVREAIDKGVVASARHHYSRFGYYEHRLPYKIDIDKIWYLQTYPDVQTAVERKHYTSGQAHFEAAGFREGRLPYPDFKLSLAE